MECCAPFWMLNRSHQIFSMVSASCYYDGQFNARTLPSFNRLCNLRNRTCVERIGRQTCAGPCPLCTSSGPSIFPPLCLMQLASSLLIWLNNCSTLKGLHSLLYGLFLLIIGPLVDWYLVLEEWNIMSTFTESFYHY